MALTMHDSVSTAVVPQEDSGFIIFMPTLLQVVTEADTERDAPTNALTRGADCG
jgi:predicted RNase H-like HicB family nuclease